MFNSLCFPAIIFLIYGLVNIFLAIFKLSNKLALQHFLTTILGTTVLNFFCEKGLSYISWLVILVPFFIIAMTTAYEKMKEYDNDRKRDMLMKLNKNSDIILYHDHGDSGNNPHYKHGKAFDEDDLVEYEKILKKNDSTLVKTVPIDNKRNYKYNLDPVITGDSSGGFQPGDSSGGFQPRNSNIPDPSFIPELTKKNDVYSEKYSIYSGTNNMRFIRDQRLISY